MYQNVLNKNKQTKTTLLPVNVRFWHYIIKGIEGSKGRDIWGKRKSCKTEMRISVSFYCERWWDVWVCFVFTVKHKSGAYHLQTGNFCKSSDFGVIYEGLAWLLDSITLPSRYLDKIKTCRLLEGQLAENHQSLWCSHYHKSILGIPAPSTLSVCPGILG